MEKDDMFFEKTMQRVRGELRRITGKEIPSCTVAYAAILSLRQGGILTEQFAHVLHALLAVCLLSPQERRKISQLREAEWARAEGLSILRALETVTIPK